MAFLFLLHIHFLLWSYNLKLLIVFLFGSRIQQIHQLSDQEDLIVWMRTAALPSFRKLYGRIEEDLDTDDVILVSVSNNYNTYSFGGRKKLVLSTVNWLGGRNNFLGMAYIAVGSCCIVLALVFLLLHLKNPRYTSKVNLVASCGLT